MSLKHGLHSHAGIQIKGTRFRKAIARKQQVWGCLQPGGSYLYCVPYQANCPEPQKEQGMRDSPKTINQQVKIFSPLCGTPCTVLSCLPWHLGAPSSYTHLCHLGSRVGSMEVRAWVAEAVPCYQLSLPRVTEDRHCVHHRHRGILPGHCPPEADEHGCALTAHS